MKATAGSTGVAEVTGQLKIQEQGKSSRPDL